MPDDQPMNTFEVAAGQHGFAGVTWPQRRQRRGGAVCGAASPGRDSDHHTGGLAPNVAVMGPDREYLLLLGVYPCFPPAPHSLL